MHDYQAPQRSVRGFKAQTTGTTLTNHSHRLAAVNFFLGCVGAVQVTRILMWQRSQDSSATETAQAVEQEAVGTVKAVAGEAEGAVKKVADKVEKST